MDFEDRHCAAYDRNKTKANHHRDAERIEGAKIGSFSVLLLRDVLFLEKDLPGSESRLSV